MFRYSHKLLRRFLPMAAAARGVKKRENSDVDVTLVALSG